jgi:putative methionine-R-sulfoxide reductase with GAF domain
VGLAGEDIPIGARILSVVDCFDALTSDRPYRPRLDDAAALRIIVERRGTMYDPRIVDAFLEMHAEVSAKGGAPAPALAVAAPAHPPASLAHPAQPSAERELLDLRAFYDLGRTLAQSPSGEQAAETLWMHLRTRIPASAFVLYVYDQAGDALVAAHAAGEMSNAFQGTRMRLGERLSGWVAGTRQAVLNSDARLDLPEELREQSALRSALSVPIESDEGIAGVLTFYARHADAFDETHRRLAQAAAAACADNHLLHASGYAG